MYIHTHTLTYTYIPIHAHRISYEHQTLESPRNTYPSNMLIFPYKLHIHTRSFSFIPYIDHIHCPIEYIEESRSITTSKNVVSVLIFPYFSLMTIEAHFDFTGPYKNVLALSSFILFVNLTAHLTIASKSSDSRFCL